MKTMVNGVIFFIVFCVSLIQAGSIDIISSDKTSSVIGISLDAPVITPVILNGTSYQRVSIPGLASTNSQGLPALPRSFVRLITAADPSLAVTVTGVEADTIQNVNVEPAELPAPAIAGRVTASKFVVNSVYSQDAFYPEAVAKVNGVELFAGVPVSAVSICPVSFNPVRHQIVVIRKMQITLSYASAPSVDFGSMRQTIVNRINSAANFKSYSSGSSKAASPILYDNVDDEIIITTTQYAAAAESLAVWQRMEGYGVKVVSQDSWSSASAVQTVINTFYANTTPKPGYVLIMGGINDVPASAEIAANSLYDGGYALGNSAFPTDQYYACMDGGTDYVPEMAHGRLVADNASEMTTIVNKIIKYERTPPTIASFYTNAVATGYFTDGTDGQAANGIEDRRMIETAEDIKQYLTPIGITSERIYSADVGATPLYWSNYWSDGSPLPAELLQSNGFTWTSNGSDGSYIDDAINRGIFFMYHYDHGNVNCWGGPYWSTGNIPNLSNGDLLPVIFSIDCLVGQWDYAGGCLAQQVVSKSNGGAVGIVAASTESYSGPNESIEEGMIDAIWPSPGLVLNSPQTIKTTFPSHAPIKAMGDVVNQGIARMAENVGQLIELNYLMYHWFGDPTMKIWTALPTVVSAVNDNTIAANATSFAVSGLTGVNGMATLYNTATDSVVGKAEVTSSSVQIPISGRISQGDNLTLTITGDNVRPYIATVQTGATSSKVLAQREAAFSLKMLASKSLMLSVPSAGNYKLSVTSLDGRTLVSKTVRLASGSNSFNAGLEKLASGVVIVKLSGQAGVISNRCIIH